MSSAPKQQADLFPPHPESGPDLLVRWEPFWPGFLQNLQDTLLRREPPPIALTSRPAPFWPDVFVNRPIPWKNFAQSGGLHVGLLVLIYATGHMWLSRQPQLEDRLSHTTITYYNVAEELPAVTPPKAAPRPRQPRKGEPELAKQEIISVPANADNSTQTLVNPPHPNVLRQEVPLPNMMVWTTIPAPPMAALRSRVTLPQMEFKPVAPPPDISRLRQSSPLKMTIPDVVEAQPSLDAVKASRSDLTLASAPDAVAPAPKLELPLQKAALSGMDQGARNVVPPPPSLGAPGSGALAAGQLLSLSVRPSPPAAEIKVPDGSRSGVFAAGPTGRAGAPGTPNIPASGGTSETGTGNSETKSPGAGTGSGTSPVAGISVTGGPSSPASGTVVAAAPSPVAPAGPRPTARPFSTFDRPPVPMYPPPGSRTDDRKVEDQVFNGKKSYSMKLNMANLTSSGGSWIIHFAELKDSKEQGELSTPTVTNKVDPAYPPDLIKDQVEGIVTLYAVIHADGSVGQVRVLQGIHERLDESARKALGRWHFRPAMKNGVAVDLEAVVSVPFKARRLTGF